MSDKLLSMPTDDELFQAFSKALQEGTPEGKRAILSTFEPFLAKAKEHLKDIIAVGATGLELNLTKESGDKLMAGFISAQNFLLKIPLKAALILYGAGSFTNFITATKAGKNNPETTIGGLAHIATLCMQKLSDKYAVSDTETTITDKVKALFA